MYFNFFIANRDFTEKRLIPTKKHITPEEYEKRTGKPYPDNAPVFVLDDDDNGHSFWVKAKYGRAKHLTLPIVCDTPIPRKSKNTPK
jgi:hypothetical protein